MNSHLKRRMPPEGDTLSNALASRFDKSNPAFPDLIINQSNAAFSIYSSGRRIASFLSMSRAVQFAKGVSE